MAEKYKTYVLFCKVGAVPKLSDQEKEARRARVLEGAQREARREEHGSGRMLGGHERVVPGAL